MEPDVVVRESILPKLSSLVGLRIVSKSRSRGSFPPDDCDEGAMVGVDVDMVRGRPILAAEPSA
jgi:hypothetical protein